MRIVGGTMRGRRISAPKGTGTRPTTDRVREAVFSAIASLAGSDLGGGSALDAFAGSGALGIEALSRGCSHVTFVERDRSALQTLRANIEALGIASDVTVVPKDVVSTAALRIPGAPFALILLDPPYTLDAAAVARVLQGLAATGSLCEGAVVTWEYATGSNYEWPEGFDVVRHKRYGDTDVEFAVWTTGEGNG